MKTCTKCKKEKKLTEFGKRKKVKDGRKSWCNACKNKQAREVYNPEKEKARWADYRSRNEDQIRDKQLKKKFDISIDEYNEMLYNQGGCCKICGIHHTELKISLAVDHNHETNKVRGLLCDTCNRGIGFLQDDAELTQIATNYLLEYEND